MNESIAQWLFSLSFRNSFLDAATVFFARYFPYILILGFIGFLLAKPARRRLFIFLEASLALLLSRGIVTEGIRFFYRAVRPFEAWHTAPLVTETLGNSFPSGHAAFYFALAMTLFFWNKKWGLWFFFFAIVNGIARIIAGTHWPIDVAGGAAIGVGSACLIHLLLKRSWSALGHSLPKSPVVSPSSEPENSNGAA